MTRRLDRYDAIVAIASVAAFGVLVWLGRGLTFFADEWEVIENRPIGLETFFRPFNEHWLGVTTLVYRGLVEVIGLGSYVPYLALLAALHLLVAALLYVVVRRRTHPVIAAGVATVFLFFGSGFENLYWGMQIGFLGAIALGLGALLLLDGQPSLRQALAACGLLAISVATSGFGLFMLGLVGLDVLLDRRRWRLLPVVLVPAATWLTWYLVLGRSTVAIYGDPFTLGQFLAIPGFVLRGAGTAFGGATGVGPLVGIGVAFGVVGWIALIGVRDGEVPRLAIAGLGAIAAMYGLLALVRSQLEGVDASQYTRYTYLSGLFALIVLGALIGRRTVPAAGRRRSIAFAAGAAAFALALTWNGALLVAGRGLFAERADLTRAYIELATSRPLPSGVRSDLNLVLVPSPSALPALLERYGSPLTDALAADTIPPISDDARREALSRARNPPEWLVKAADRAGAQSSP